MDILFAEKSKREVTQLKDETVKDLAIQDIADNIADNETEMLVIKDIFTHIPKDIRDMQFRQNIMKDLLDSEELTEELAEAVSHIKTLRDFGASRTRRMNDEKSLYVLLEDLRELDTYVIVTEKIRDCLSAHDIKSEGLKRVLEETDKIVSDEKFELAKKDIKTMLKDLSNVRGAIIGVNFTPDLNIDTVTMVDFKPHKIKSKYKFAEIASGFHNILASAAATNSIGSPFVPTRVYDPLLVSMTPLVEKHIKLQCGRMKRLLSKYIRLDSGPITEMYEGFLYYIAMARFSRRLKSEGCVISVPELAEKEAGTVELSMKELYNVRLFLAGEKNIVKNDFTFSPEENLYILTGPNRGGKTIIEQAIGINSILAASGSYVMASQFKGRPFGNILTHFPIDENLTINYGRLGEEAIRIKEIVKEADSMTLILFNETYSTTSSSDGLYLSKDLLHVLKEKGVAAIFNTHIHEVARAIDEMNKWEGRSSFISIIMEIKDNQNTFKVKRSEPDSCSYARNIAEKYGITYEQMK